MHKRWLGSFNFVFVGPIQFKNRLFGVESLLFKVLIVHRRDHLFHEVIAVKRRKFFYHVDQVFVLLPQCLFEKVMEPVTIELDRNHPTNADRVHRVPWNECLLCDTKS